MMETISEEEEIEGKIFNLLGFCLVPSPSTDASSVRTVSAQKAGKENEKISKEKSDFGYLKVA